MNIIVVGCGKIGTTILANLVGEGHAVTAVDIDPAVITEINNIYDVMGVCGNGTDCDTLTEAGVQSANLVVAATASDEFNMLTCFLARKLGARHTIARIRNPEYNDSSLGFLKQQLNLSMPINPELLAAQELYNLLKVPSAVKIDTFSRRNFELVELRLQSDSQLGGMTLAELKKKYKANYLICAVKRDGKVYIPDGSFVLNGGDKIGVTTTPSEILKLLKMLGESKKQAKSVMILGASRIAYYLSKMLINSGNSVTIVEKKHEKCKAFSESLPEAVIIQGDGAQQELLLEEGLGSTDAFISLTGTDEQNILISYFAHEQNVPKVITKINREEFTPMAERLGLDTVVSPKKIVSDVVLRYARALQNSLDSEVETLYKLMDSEVEALEFIVRPDCSIINIPLKDMRIRKGVLIGGIIRGRKAIIPSGFDVILPDDRVVIIAEGKRLNSLSDIIE